MIKKIIKFFSSLKLTIFILIILAFTSIIGTLFQQQQNPAIYVQQYGEPLYNIFKTLGFFDLYHSWWFISLLIMLVVNLVFCNLRRLPKDLKLIFFPKIEMNETDLESFNSKEKITITNSSLDRAIETVVDAMKNGGFPCRKKQRYEKGWYFFSEKGKYGRLAFHITHLSIILIFIGAIIGAARGFKGFVNIPEGEKINSITLTSQDGRSINKDLTFEVECQKFEVSYYMDKNGNLTNRPKDYKSLLAIYEQDKMVLSKEIEVNAPLSYKGIYFYQSSFGEIPKITISVKTSEGEAIGDFDLGELESFHFKDKNNQEIEVRLLRYIPDFTMNANRQFVSRSNIPNNPAALLEINQNGQATETWVFQRFPEFPHGRTSEHRYVLAATNGAKKYTGLQVVWDPGVPVVWAGCIILIVGIIILFSVPHYRVWVTITDNGNNQIVNLVGTTNKNKPGFQRIFSKFSTNFKTYLADRKR